MTLDNYSLEHDRVRVLPVPPGAEAGVNAGKEHGGCG